MTISRIPTAPLFKSSSAAMLWVNSNLVKLNADFPNQSFKAVCINPHVSHYAVYAETTEGEIEVAVMHKFGQNPMETNPEPAPKKYRYLYPTTGENKVNSEIKKHREIFGKPTPPRKQLLSKSTYQFISHELRYRRFLIMRKDNPEYFGIENRFITSLRNHTQSTLKLYCEYYPEMYNHLLREIQDNNRSIQGSVWGITHFGIHNNQKGI